MTGARRKVLLVLAGTLVGFSLLEAGLWFFGDVERGFRTHKVGLFTTQGGGVCFAPSVQVELPLDARRSEDRAWLLANVTEWNMAADGTPLDQVLDEVPRCLLFEADVRLRGVGPSRVRTLPLLGDSFAFGDGLPISHSLGSLLADALPDTNVPTYGVPGADVLSVASQVDAFLTDLAREPKACTDAIYIFNFNDVVTAAGVTTFDGMIWNDHPSWLQRRYGPRTRLEKLLSLTHTWWVLRHRLVRRQVTEQTSAVYREWYFGRGNQSGRTRTRQALVAMRDRLAARKIRLRVVLYPLLVEEAFGGYSFQDIHDEILAWCAEDGLACYDGAAAVLAAGPAKTLTVDRQDTHPNGVANRAMVRYVLDEVLDSRGGEAVAGTPSTGSASQ